MWRFSLLILVRPRQIITELLGASLKIRNVLAFLFWVGLARGLLEVIWLLAVSHRLDELSLLARHGSWWWLEAGPFVVANVLTAYFRWALYGLVWWLALRWLHVVVEFSQVLRIVAAMMGLYVVTILVNFLHGAVDLSMVQFHIAETFAPSLGIGQGVSVVLAVWLFSSGGRALGLDRLSSLLTALLVIVVERSVYFAAASAYFSLPLIRLLPYRHSVWLANHLTTVASLLGAVALLWTGYRLNARHTPAT